MNQYAYLFAGQGQQFLNMGVDLASMYPVAKERYERVHTLSGIDVLHAPTFDDALTLQLALYTLECSLVDILDGNPVAVAGLSIGECAAAYAAGYYDFDAGVALVMTRAQLMASAQKGAMVAVIRATAKEVNASLFGSLAISNYNSPKQLVVGGLEADVDQWIASCGFRTIKLNMSTLSHHQALQDESMQLQAFIETMPLHESNVPFYVNHTGALINHPLDIVLSEQLSHPIQFERIVLNLADQGITKIYEIGPKGALARLVKDIAPNIEVITIYDVETLGAYVQ